VYLLILCRARISIVVIARSQFEIASQMSASGQERTSSGTSGMSAFGVPPQPVDATHALNLSAGVSNPSVLRGRSFSCRATLFR